MGINREFRPVSHGDFGGGGGSIIHFGIVLNLIAFIIYQHT